VRRRVLFICTHNSARSQMTEGLLRALYGDRYEAYSVGTQPTEVNPYVIRVMAEIGIDISDHRSKSVNEFLNEEFDYVITVYDRAKETRPFFPRGKRYIHRGFDDPSSFHGSDDEKLDFLRRVRDEIKRWMVVGSSPTNATLTVNRFRDVIIL